MNYLKLNTRLRYILVVVVLSALWLGLISCTNSSVSMATSTIEPIATVVPAAPTMTPLPVADFPLTAGTTWVYAYNPYDASPEDPMEIVTATYIMTETVVSAEEYPPYTFVEIQRDYQLTSDEALENYNLPQLTYWYVISGTQVFEEYVDPAIENFSPYESRLAYDLPLEMGKNWCPIVYDPSNPDNPEVINCEVAGMRTVVEQGPYESPAGEFDDCFWFVESYNSGGVHRWFCNGIGVVAAKYDHSGTRFGFDQVLIDFALIPPK